MSLALLAIQNILQNSNIFNRSRETVHITPFSDKLSTSVSYLKTWRNWLTLLAKNYCSRLNRNVP